MARPASVYILCNDVVEDHYIGASRYLDTDGYPTRRIEKHREATTQSVNWPGSRLRPTTTRLWGDRGQSFTVAKIIKNAETGHKGTEAQLHRNPPTCPNCGRPAYAKPFQRTTQGPRQATRDQRPR